MPDGARTERQALAEDKVSGQREDIVQVLTGVDVDVPSRRLLELGLALPPPRLVYLLQCPLAVGRRIRKTHDRAKQRRATVSQFTSPATKTSSTIFSAIFCWSQGPASCPR